MAMDRKEPALTSRMLDAGIDAWIEHMGGDDCEALVRAIFLAMWRQSSEYEHQSTKEE